MFKSELDVHAGVERSIEAADVNRCAEIVVEPTIEDRCHEAGLKGRGYAEGSFSPYTQYALTVSCVDTRRVQICESMIQVHRWYGTVTGRHGTSSRPQ